MELYKYMYNLTVLFCRFLFEIVENSVKKDDDACYWKDALYRETAPIGPECSAPIPWGPPI